MAASVFAGFAGAVSFSCTSATSADAGPACTVPCGDAGCCFLGQACTNGVCADPNCQPSCPTGQRCLAGTCFDPCTRSGECSVDAGRCCVPAQGGGGVCYSSATAPRSDIYVPLSFACLCDSAADCTDGDACGESVDLSLHGAFLCAGTTGCSPDGGPLCRAGACCWADTRANFFCADPCNVDADCSPGLRCHLDYQPRADPPCVSAAGACGPP